MRTILLFAFVCLLVAPVASAARPLPVDVDVDPEAHVSPPGCNLCVDASTTVIVRTLPDNCADCPIYVVHADAHAGRDGVEAHVLACQYSLASICYVDETIRI